MKTSEVLFLLLLVSCGGHEENNCKTREQMRTICVAGEIEKEPEPWKYDEHVRYCNSIYVANGCYDQ